VTTIDVNARTKLAAAQDDDVPRLRILHPLSNALMRGRTNKKKKGNRAARTSVGILAPKEPAILIHIERSPADHIWSEYAHAEVVDEPEGGDDEGGGARELGAAVGGGVIPIR
jgi:hypothetical protein